MPSKVRSGQTADTASGQKLMHSRQELPIGVATMRFNYVSFKIQFIFNIQRIKNTISFSNKCGNRRITSYYLNTNWVSRPAANGGQLPLQRNHHNSSVDEKLINRLPAARDHINFDHRPTGFWLRTAARDSSAATPILNLIGAYRKLPIDIKLGNHESEPLIRIFSRHLHLLNI